MPRIGILTFHHANNYGAVLQAFGLSDALKEMGHEVEIIDYRPIVARELYESRLPLNPRIFYREFMFRQRFNQFRKRHLPLSRKFLSPESLHSTEHDYDVIVCGSDQVWNVTSYRGYDPTFFLDFISSSRPKRVSYAATFGGATVSDLGNRRTEIQSLIEQFDRLSVRDAHSLGVLESLTPREVTHVLDPVFLTNFDAITPPRLIEEPYVFSYCLNPSELLMEATSVISNTLGCPVISARRYLEGIKLLHPGPLEWLSLLRHATFVCTDSFHGTCFSIKDRKQFLCLPSKSGMSRIEDLLEATGLTERIVRDKQSLAETLSEQIDFDAVQPRIDSALSRSEDYISGAIEQCT